MFHLNTDPSIQTSKTTRTLAAHVNQGRRSVGLKWRAAGTVRRVSECVVCCLQINAEPYEGSQSSHIWAPALRFASKDCIRLCGTAMVSMRRVRTLHCERTQQDLFTFAVGSELISAAACVKFWNLQLAWSRIPGDRRRSGLLLAQHQKGNVVFRTLHVPRASPFL